MLFTMSSFCEVRGGGRCGRGGRSVIATDVKFRPGSLIWDSGGWDKMVLFRRLWCFKGLRVWKAHDFIAKA